MTIETELNYKALDAAMDGADDAYLAEGDDNLAFKKAVLTAIKTYLAAVETELPAVKALETGATVDEFVSALVILAEAGIPTDVQDLLVRGDPMRGIKPNALYDALGFSASEHNRLKRENEHFTKSGIIEVAVRNISVSDYMNHWEGRALAAESRCEDLVKALELAEGRLSLLLQQYPDESETCDHPIATRYVLDKVSAALKELGKGDGR